MASSCDADELFRLFTLPASDFFKSYLIIDLRDVKQFSKGHLNQAFCVRLSSNGKVCAEPWPSIQLGKHDDMPH